MWKSFFTVILWLVGLFAGCMFTFIGLRYALWGLNVVSEPPQPDALMMTLAFLGVGVGFLDSCFRDIPK